MDVEDKDLACDGVFIAVKLLPLSGCKVYDSCLRGMRIPGCFTAWDGPLHQY